MPSEGPLAPTAFSADGGGMEWQNGDLIFALDAKEASVSGFPPNGSFTSEKLSALTFGFSIPASAEVTGVLIHIIGRTSLPSESAELVLQGIQLEEFNTGIGTPTDSSVILEENWDYSIGGPTSLLGATLTPTIVNGSSFGCRFGVFAKIPDSTRVIYVDLVEMTIYYLPGVPPIGESGVIMRRRRQWRG